MSSDGDSSFMADYNTQRQLVVPPDIDAVGAALSISLAETASTLAHVPNLRERTVVVAGTGIAGLSYTLWATLAGARVITLGRRRERGELAERVGADRAIMTTERNWHEALSCEIPRGADLIIDAVGSPSLATKLQSQLNDHGTALVYGVASKGRSYPTLWRPARVEEQNTYEWVLSLIRKQLVDPQPFHSHTWPFAEIGAAIDEAAAGRVVKGIVTF
jgi:threonine dehydrogenase-like Zn-dependent dehydrogenase